MTEKVLDDI